MGAVPPEQDQFQEQATHLIGTLKDLQRAIETLSCESIKFLTLANGAGAVALLGLMGSSEAGRADPQAMWALRCFGLGIILVGGLLALGFHRSWRLFTQLAEDIRAWSAGSLEYNAVLARMTARTGSLTASYICAYGSLLAFIAGALIATFGISGSVCAESAQPIRHGLGTD